MDGSCLIRFLPNGQWQDGQEQIGHSTRPFSLHSPHRTTTTVPAFFRRLQEAMVAEEAATTGRVTASLRLPEQSKQGRKC